MTIYFIFKLVVYLYLLWYKFMVWQKLSFTLGKVEWYKSGERLLVMEGTEVRLTNNHTSVSSITSNLTCQFSKCK